MAPVNKPQEVLISGAMVRESVGGKVEVTAPGGSTKIMSGNELAQLKKMLDSLSPPSSTAGALAKSVRLFGAPLATLLESAAKVGTTLVAMANKYGLAFTADIAGSHLKYSIENLIDEAKKGVLG